MPQNLYAIKKRSVKISKDYKRSHSTAARMPLLVRKHDLVPCRVVLILLPLSSFLFMLKEAFSVKAGGFADTGVWFPTDEHSNRGIPFLLVNQFF